MDNNLIQYYLLIGNQVKARQLIAQQYERVSNGCNGSMGSQKTETKKDIRVGIKETTTARSSKE